MKNWFYIKQVMKILALFILVTGCAGMGNSGKQIDVFDLVEPSGAYSIRLKRAYEANDFSKLEGIFKTNLAKTQEQRAWFAYYKGLYLIKKNKTDEALSILKEHYQLQVAKSGLSQETYRVLGNILKKIGEIYRAKKDNDKAFAYHQYRLGFVKAYGSNLEIHDALISLDVDAYMMNNPHLSEYYLFESLKYAQKIGDTDLRLKAIGTSKNNLGGTLYKLKKFSDAEKQIIGALVTWKKYEARMGEKENKLVWAYNGVGDVYENWGLYLKTSNEPFAKKDLSVKKSLAIEAFKKTLSIGKERNMPQNVLDQFNNSIKRVQKL